MSQSDRPVLKQLRALNRMATSFYINSTVATTFSTAAYCIDIISAKANIKAMTNTWMVNDTRVASADTLVAGDSIYGKITAITMVSGRAIAYCAPAAVFLK